MLLNLSPDSAKRLRSDANVRSNIFKRNILDKIGLLFYEIFVFFLSAVLQ